jgi:hypothetical protein
MGARATLSDSVRFVTLRVFPRGTYVRVRRVLGMYAGEHTVLFDVFRSFGRKHCENALTCL